jgi:hypothetical protein
MHWTTKESEFDSRLVQEVFPFFTVQTGFGAHPISCPIRPAGLFTRVKAAGALS